MTIVYPIAQALEAGQIAVLIPIVAIIAGCATAIIRSLTKHQREMAELLHGKGVVQDSRIVDELVALRNQVAQLQDRVNEVAIRNDAQALSNAHEPPAELPERLKSS